MLAASTTVPTGVSLAKRERVKPPAMGEATVKTTPGSAEMLEATVSVMPRFGSVVNDWKAESVPPLSWMLLATAPVRVAPKERSLLAWTVPAVMMVLPV